MHIRDAWLLFGEGVHVVLMYCLEGALPQHALYDRQCTTICMVAISAKLARHVMHGCKSTRNSMLCIKHLSLLNEVALRVPYYDV